MDPPINLEEIWLRNLDEQGQRFTAQSNNASRLGHPCLRWLTYIRTVAPPKFDLESMKRIREGSIQEHYIFDTLRELGRKYDFEVIEGQVPVEWNKYQIKGRLDGILKRDNIKYPFEIKTTGGLKFHSFTSIQDFDRKWYNKNWFAQLQVYMLLRELERGVLILKNREQSEIRPFWFDLDYGYAESLIKKAEQINEHIAKKTLPDRIPYSEDICGRCEYQVDCLPNIDFGPEMKLMQDEELEAEIIHWHEIQEAGKEWRNLDKKIKDKIKKYGIEKAMVGDFLITTEKKFRKGYAIEDGESTYVNIDKIGG